MQGKTAARGSGSRGPRIGRVPDLSDGRAACTLNKKGEGEEHENPQTVYRHSLL